MDLKLKLIKRYFYQINESFIQIILENQCDYIFVGPDQYSLSIQISLSDQGYFLLVLRLKETTNHFSDNMKKNLHNSATEY